MRIGIATDTYRPYISGVTVYISQLKEALIRRGHEVYVFTFGKPGEISDDSVILSPGFRLKMGYAFGLNYARNARLKMLEMDVIHVQHPFISGQLALRVVRGKKPIVFTAHTRYDHFVPDYLPWLPERWVEAALSRYMIGFCHGVDRVVTNSEASAEGLRNIHVDVPFVTIPNGIDLLPFKEVRPTSANRHKLGDWPVQVMYAGRMAIEKDLPILLDAFALLAARYPQAGLAMVGGGPMVPALRAQVTRLGLEGRVVFTGAVPHECLPEMVQAADIFVMPSRKDTHPLNVIEAMAAGKAVVAVASPAYTGTITSGLDGLICEPGFEELASGMEALLMDASARDRMGKAAAKTVERFSMDEVVDNLIALYTQVVTEYPRDRDG